MFLSKVFKKGGILWQNGKHNVRHAQRVREVRSDVKVLREVRQSQEVEHEAHLGLHEERDGNSFFSIFSSCFHIVSLYQCWKNHTCY